MEDFKRQFLTAKRVINEIKNGEWKAEYNPLGECCYIALRHSEILWLGDGTGPWFCDITTPAYKGVNAFGLLLRHWVWHCGAKQLKRECEQANKVK